MVKDKKQTYEVEAIVGKKMVNGKPLYLVKWEGYGADENTWEPLSNLKTCQDMVDEFEIKGEEIKPCTKRPRRDASQESPKTTSKSPKLARKLELTESDEDEEDLAAADVKPSTSSKVGKTNDKSGDKPLYLLTAFRDRVNKLHYVLELENGSYRVVEAEVAHRQYRKSVMDFLTNEAK